MVIRKLEANNPVNRHVSGTLLSSAGLFEVRNGARAGTIYIKIDPHFSTPTFSTATPRSMYIGGR